MASVSSLALASGVLLAALQGTVAAKAPYKHVGVFSVDGLHSSDITKYLAMRPHSNIAKLIDTGYLYPNVNTSAPSDSYPGSIAQYTGATPRVTGVWYDVTYDRAFYPVGSKCKGPAGTVVADDESIDYNSTQLFSGGINPALLPMYRDSTGACSKLYPHNRIRVNTAFEVVRNNGMETAYTDKHPAYDIMRGPSGQGLTTGYFPEIAAVPVTVPDTIKYDELHVNAFLHWLDAKVPKHSEGTLSAVPALFGGNFQAVSVAQKAFGYQNTTGQPFTPELLHALDFVDASLGKVVDKLKAKGLYRHTLLVVASKHGQAPINAQLYRAINPTAVTAATKVPIAYATTDDIALIFLNDSSTTQRAVNHINAHGSSIDLFQLYSQAKSGSMSLTANNFGDPATDPAVPDIIVVPALGVIYTTNYAKIAEHGGISNDDRNVACFISSPKLKKRTFTTQGYTTQIAPVILKALGLNPEALQGVVQEDTMPLPGF